MFLEILKTVIRVIAVFSVLFIAFGLTFHILLINDAHQNFKSPLMSVLYAMLMMMGSWDFASVYTTPYNDDTLMYPVVNVAIVCVFVRLMPMLFINMLIGLAVGDIELVLRDATLKRLAMQVEYHTEMEERLPRWFLDRMDENECVIYPNKGIAHAGRFVHVWRLLEKIADLVISGSHTLDNSDDSHSEIIFEELERQKRRFEIVQHHMEKQSHMLRSMMQRMEIAIEVDHDDEAASVAIPKDNCDTFRSKKRTSVRGRQRASRFV